MFDRKFPPPPSVLPVAAIRKACEQWQKAESELRDAEREVQQLHSEDGAARVADVQATAAAMAARKPDPGPERQREHAARVEAAERRRDARRLLADQRWNELATTWRERQGDLDAARAKEIAQARERWDALIAELEPARRELAEAAALADLCGGGDMKRWRPERYLTMLPIVAVHDGPTGAGSMLVGDMFAALAGLGAPPPPRPELQAVATGASAEPA